MNRNVLLSLVVYLIFNAYSLFEQINGLSKKSSNGEIAGILDFHTLFVSPIPVFVLQFLIILVIFSGFFILSQSYFSEVFSRKIQTYISNSWVAKTLWLIIANCSLFILNATYFPHSVNLTHYFYLWPEHHPNIFLLWFVIFIPFVLYFIANIKRKAFQLGGGFALCLILGFHLSAEPTALDKNSASTETKPNIIIIGVDSLRKELLESQMPFLAKQLEDSVVFKNAYSPLGRTFPAWNTILSGLYPANHGARINLIDRTQLTSTENYLPSILKESGYTSIFSIDETRFANLGEHQGFDQTITPRMGASDFLIGNFHDFPIINLLSLSQYSAWLLPEIYANRAAAKTYRPNTFNELINRELPVNSKPTLFAIHFCLPHWPYVFSINQPPYKNYVEPYYPLNLQAVDKQIESLMETLEQKGYLENSRIIFLSDHGEAWVHESPTFHNKHNPDDEYKIEEYGHGSSVLSHSSEILIAFKGFSEAKNISINTNKTTTLADIVPTIIDELNIGSRHQFNGSSLISSTLKDRIIPIETGTVLSLDSDHGLDIDKILNDFLNRYELQPSGLLTIRPDKIEEGLQAKIYGLRSQEEILQQTKQGGFMLFHLKSQTYLPFNDLNHLSQQEPKWAEAWCDNYKVSCSM